MIPLTNLQKLLITKVLMAHGLTLKSTIAEFFEMCNTAENIHEVFMTLANLLSETVAKMPDPED